MGVSVTGGNLSAPPRAVEKVAVEEDQWTASTT